MMQWRTVLLKNIITGQDGNEQNDHTENPIINKKHQIEAEAVKTYQIIYRF